MRKPIRIALVAGTAVVIAAGGTTAAFALQGNSHDNEATTSTSTSSTVSPRSQRVSADRARQIAQQLVRGGTVTKTELDHEHGRAVWEVDLTRQHREYEVHIDAATGKITGVSASPTHSHAGQPAAPAKVNAEQARQIAQQRLPGTTVTETKRDHEHGRAVWEVDLTKQHHQYEVTIDAMTGKVISVHHD